MTERDLTAAKLKLGLLVLMAALCWLLTSHAHGITPRIAADGKTHLGCKGEKP